MVGYGIFILLLLLLLLLRWETALEQEQDNEEEEGGRATSQRSIHSPCGCRAVKPRGERPSRRQRGPSSPPE